MRKFKIVFVMVVLFFSVFIKGALAEEQGPIVKRLEGKNRIETSISVSKEVFEKSDTAIIVGFNGEVDALTGTILAVEKDAPILMSYKDKLDNSLIGELKRLKTKKVYIIGGETVVEFRVEEALMNLGLEVVRIKGASREETAIKVSKEAISTPSDEAFLALGYGVYADALAIGPIAANKNSPLLLTKSNAIKKETIDFLKESNINKVTIVGGDNAVNYRVESILKKEGIDVKRVKGNSREETAIEIANKYVSNPDKIIIANGYKYADAVVGGYLGAKENSAILLNGESYLNDKNEAYIREKGISTTILGGKSSIGESILKNIKVELGIIKDEIIGHSGGIENDSPGAESKPNIGKLPGNTEELKVIMKAKLESFEDNISIEYEGSITSEDVRVIIRDIYSDGSYIGGAIKRITPGAKKIGDNSEVILTPEYHNTKKEEAFIDTEVDRIIAKIIKPGMSEFQEVKAVHDYIVNNTTYSNDTKKTSHSAYTALAEGKAVCQGYALLTYRFLDALDIENYYVLGDTLGKKDWGSHAWNLVKVDGKYYNLDVTKDDPVAVDGNHILSYRYFLASDKNIASTHRISNKSFPKAVDTKYQAINSAYNSFEYKNTLYFGNINDGEKLYSFSLDNLKLKKLSDNRSPYVVVRGNKIYFSNFSSGGHIYSSDLNGKGLKQINKVYSTNLKLEDKTIKFFNKKAKKWDRISIK